MLTDAMFREIVWKLCGLLVACMAVLGFISYFLFLGFWKKTLQPLVLSEIKTYQETAAEQERHRQLVQKELEAAANTQTSATQRVATIKATVVMIENEPENVKKREDEIRRVIDSEISRRDGLIAKEFEKKRNENDEALGEFEKKLLKEIAPLKESFERLVKIEGMLHVLLKTVTPAHSASDAPPR